MRRSAGVSAGAVLPDGAIRRTVVRRGGAAGETLGSEFGRWTRGRAVRTPAGGTRWSLAQRRGRTARARTADGPAGSAGRAEVDAAACTSCSAALTAMRDGNFRSRLTVSGDGPMAEIAAVFNEVADRNQHLTGELARVRRVVGREGRAHRAAGDRGRRGRLGRGDRRLATRWSTTWSGRCPRSAGCCRRSPRATSTSGWTCARTAPDGGGASAARRVPEGRPDRQRPGRPAVGVHRRGDAGGQRGGHRGQAGRPGPGARASRAPGRTSTDSVNTMAYRLTAQVRDIAAGDHGGRQG